MGDASPPSAIFNNALDEENFSIILNLFITICLSCLKNVYSKLCEQNASNLVKNSKLGTKNVNKICLKIVQKALKWPSQCTNFQKYSGGAVAAPRGEMGGTSPPHNRSGSFL